jgi:hypothetical protein
MQADFSIELGPSEDCLEVPWASADGRLRYFDLRRQPELLLEVSEAHENRELAEFLTSINSPTSIFESAKCDTWVTDEIAEEEQVFGASWKFACYVDIIFSEVTWQTALEKHEGFARAIVQLLNKAPDIAAAAEFIVRRCYYHANNHAASSDVELAGSHLREGYGITLYSYGYGDDASEARLRWIIGLKVVQNALLQMSAQHKKVGMSRA